MLSKARRHPPSKKNILYDFTHIQFQKTQTNPATRGQTRVCLKIGRQVGVRGRNQRHEEKLLGLMDMTLTVGMVKWANACDKTHPPASPNF